MEVAGNSAEAAGQQLLWPHGDGVHAHGVLRVQQIGGGGDEAAPIALEEATPADSPGSWRFGGGGGYGVADAADVTNDDSDDTATTEELFEDAGEGSDVSLDSFKVTLADLGVEEPSESRRQPAMAWTVSDG